MRIAIQEEDHEVSAPTTQARHTRQALDSIDQDRQAYAAAIAFASTTYAHPTSRFDKPNLYKISRLTCLSSLQKVTPRQPAARVSRTKGHLSKRTAFVRDVVKEVAGYVLLLH